MLVEGWRLRLEGIGSAEGVKGLSNGHSRKLHMLPEVIERFRFLFF